MVPEKVNSGRSPDFSTPRRKISELPAADALTGDETIAVVQDGVTMKTTLAEAVDAVITERGIDGGTA